MTKMTCVLGRLGTPFALMLLALLLLLFFVTESTEEKTVSEGSINRKVVFSKKKGSAFARKLLQSTGDGNRIGMSTCTKDDIVILQGPAAPLPNGIPTYAVEILNLCVSSGCNISNIHVNCGWFSSARLINPTVFKRVYYDDCLVNDGQALGTGECLSFQYSNSFSYPLSVSSVSTTC